MGNIVAASARPGQPAWECLVDRYRRGLPVLVAGDKSPVRPGVAPPPARRRAPAEAPGAPGWPVPAPPRSGGAGGRPRRQTGTPRLAQHARPRSQRLSPVIKLVDEDYLV